MIPLLFVISYETKEATWKLHLLAETREDATQFLTARVGKEEGFRINWVEQREQIHYVTDKVLDSIRPPTPPIREVQPICPWCESVEYKTLHALKVHIGKNHATTEDKTPKKKSTVKK
jgi:hypothetical protein